MTHKHIVCRSDGDPLVHASVTSLQVDVRSQLVIGVTTCASIGLLGEECQLLSRCNSIGAFGSAIAASIGIGHGAVPAVGLLVAVV